MVLTALLASCNLEPIDGNDENGIDAGDIRAKIIGGSGQDEATKIIQTSDGGFLITGSSTSNDGDFQGMGIGQRHIHLTKIAANGSIEWLRTFGGSGTDIAHDVIEDRAGNFVIAGESASNDGNFSGQNRGGTDLFLIKVRPNGDLLWARKYGGSGNDIAHAVIQAPGNGYFVTGSTESNDLTFFTKDNTSRDAFVIFTDQNGAQNWTRTVGGSLTDEAFGIAITLRNGVVIAGSHQSQNGNFTGLNPGIAGIFTLELDVNAQFISLVSYAGNGVDVGRSIRQTTDGGFILAGSSDSSSGIFSDNSAGSQNAFLMKLSSNYATEWVKTVGGSSNDAAFNVIQTENNHFILTGESRSGDNDFNNLNQGENDAFLAKTDQTGSLLWVNSYGGSGSESARSLVQTSLNDIAVTGWTESSDGLFENSPGGRNFFFFLTDIDGNLRSVH
ncbi:MAG: hypothetical protein EA391_09070 [Balneolaceae bacterium]|nr:MAG: hypothetical protein EA391_09070 [Balneolaceae bacterium]